MAAAKSIILPITRELLIYLFSKISVSTKRFYNDEPCWEWTGAYSKREGYGTLTLKYEGKWYGRQAHRSMYEHFVEPVPSNLVCDHLCRNRICVNPVHMEIVTDKENILRGDGIAPKRKAQTHCVHGHELSGDNVGKCGTGRACKKCKKRLAQEYMNRIYALPKDHPKRARFDEMRRQYTRKKQAKKKLSKNTPN